MLNLLAVVQENIQLTPPEGSDFAPLADLQFSQLISGFIGLILIIAAVIFFFMLVLGGIKWMTSGGDKAQTETARNQITSALVGLVIVFAAWAIVQLIGQFFKIENILDLNVDNFIPK